jgi:hypothetical protein
MNAAMPAPERDKLAKLLALIGSDQVGERDNAISAATRLLDRHRLRWSEILSIAHVEVRAQDRPCREPPSRNCGGDWRSVAVACGRYPHLLNRWEAEFISGLPRFPRLSAKQSATFTGIVTRLRTAGCQL